MGQTAKAQGRDRVGWIDVAKGLGILLVVFGHTYRSASAIKWVYLFHMPMFFMLSGMVYRPTSPFEFMRKRTVGLMIPYASFLIIVMLLRNFITIHSSLRSLVDGDIHQLPRDAVGGRSLTGDYGTFWFVPCLFVASVAYNYLRTRFSSPTSSRFVLVNVSIALLAYVIGRSALPWDVSVVPMAMFFIWLGEVWISVFQHRSTLRAQSPIILVLASAMAIAGIIWCLPFNMKFGDYGTPVLSIITAVAMSHLTFVLSAKLASQRLVLRPLASLGQASLIILFVHRLLVLHLRDRLPDFLIVAVATLIPYLIWRLIKLSPPLARYLLLGEQIGTSSRRRAVHA